MDIDDDSLSDFQMMTMMVLMPNLGSVSLESLSLSLSLGIFNLIDKSYRKMNIAHDDKGLLTPGLFNKLVTHIENCFDGWVEQRCVQSSERPPCIIDCQRLHIPVWAAYACEKRHINLEFVANTDSKELLKNSVLRGPSFFVQSDKIEDDAKVVYIWHDRTDHRRAGMSEHKSNRKKTHIYNARLRPHTSNVYMTIVDEEHFDTFSSVTNLRMSDMLELVAFAINSKNVQCTVRDPLMQLFDWSLHTD